MWPYGNTITGRVVSATRWLLGVRRPYLFPQHRSAL